MSWITFLGCFLFLSNIFFADTQEPYKRYEAFSDDGSQVAVGMHNGPLLLFDSSSGQVLSRQWIEDSGTLMQLAFSPDGAKLAAGFATGEVKIWRIVELIE